MLTGLVAKLINFGFLPGPATDPAVIDAAVRDYQAWHELKVDGIVGPVTERHFKEFRFCGYRDNFTTEGQVCAWPMKKIVYAITGAIPGISPEDQRDAYALGWSFWAEVCGVQPEYTTNSRVANVLMGSGRIDQPGGTLAWSELPCGASATSQLKQLYGTEEPFAVFDVGEPSNGRIDIVRVVAHECGHVIGLPHAPRGSQLMSPTYSAAIRKPQAGWDVPEAVTRYQGPSLPPVPPPVPPTADAMKVLDATLKAQAAAMGYRLLKL